jgi:hypothetical protein
MVITSTHSNPLPLTTPFQSLILKMSEPTQPDEFYKFEMSAVVAIYIYLCLSEEAVKPLDQKNPTEKHVAKMDTEEG